MVKEKPAEYGKLVDELGKNIPWAGHTLFCS